MNKWCFDATNNYLKFVLKITASNLNYFYDAIVLLSFFFFLAWQRLVTICFHCMKKNSLDILLNNVLYVQQRTWSQEVKSHQLHTQ